MSQITPRRTDQSSYIMTSPNVTVINPDGTVTVEPQRLNEAIRKKLSDRLITVASEHNTSIEMVKTYAYDSPPIEEQHIATILDICEALGVPRDLIVVFNDSYSVKTTHRVACRSMDAVIINFRVRNNSEYNWFSAWIFEDTMDMLSFKVLVMT